MSRSFFIFDNVYLTTNSGYSKLYIQCPMVFVTTGMYKVVVLYLVSVSLAVLLYTLRRFNVQKTAWTKNFIKTKTMYVSSKLVQ